VGNWQTDSEPVLPEIQPPAVPAWQTGSTMDIPASAGRSRAASGLWDAAVAGYQGSATGLALRGRLPDVVLDPQHSTLLESLTSQATQMGSEFPEMAAGSIAGGAAGAAVGSSVPVVGTAIGGILGAGAGAFAVPAALRTALMLRYQNGEVQSAGDFLNRTAIVSADALKQGTVGALTAGVGAAAKPLGALAATGAEIGTMTTASAALQGKLPEPEDFLNAAIMVGGMHAAGVVSGRLREVYAQTGVRPEQVLADSKADPSIAEDLQKPAVPVEKIAAETELSQAAAADIPKAYQPMADAQAVADAIPNLPNDEAVVPEVFGPTQPIPGEPRLGRTSFQYLNTTDQMNGAILRLEQIASDGIDKANRGVVSNAETAAQAADWLQSALGEGGVPNRNPGDPVSAPEMVARKWLLERSASEMVQRALEYNKLDNPTQEQTDAWMQSNARANMATALVNSLSVKAEAGRTLQAAQITSGVVEHAQLLSDILAQSGKTPKELASMVAQLDSAEGAARMAQLLHPATKWQMVMEGWKAGLLGPTTVIKKSLSDIAMMASRPFVDAVAYGVGTLPGMEQHMTAMEPVARIAGNFLGAKEGLIQGWNVLKADFGGADTTGNVTETQHAIPGLAGQIIRLPFSALKAVTTIFECMEARGEAGAIGARQATAEGLNPMTREWWDRVGDVSTDSKQIQDFKTRMTFGAEVGPWMEAAGKLARTPIMGTNIAPGELFLPFRKVPANVLKESLRLSPFAPLVGEWRADFGEGGISRNKAIAEMAIGTAVAGLAMAYAAAGKISGSGDPDPAKRRAQLASGWQPGSILINGTWHSVGMIHPVGTLLTMAADVHEMSDRMEAGESDQAMKILQGAFAHAVTQQSFLQGMTNVVHALDAPEKSGNVFVQNLAASVVPATVSQMASMIHQDPYKRQIDSIKDAVQARIPGLREQMLPQRDALGAPVANDDRLLGISPSVASTPSTDPVRAELGRLESKGFGVGVQAAPHSINLPDAHMKDLGKVEVTPQQRDVFSTVAGQMSHQILSTMVTNPMWEHVPDALKQQMMQKVFEHGDSVAKATILSPEQRQQEMIRILAGVKSRLTASVEK